MTTLITQDMLDPSIPLGGAHDVVAEGVLSGASELDITGLDRTKAHEVHLYFENNLGGGQLKLQAYDGGVKKTAANYDWAYERNRTTAVTTREAGANQDHMRLLEGQSHPGFVIVKIPVIELSQDIVLTWRGGNALASGGAERITGSGGHDGTFADLDGINIFPSSGTLTGPYKVLELK